MEMKYFNYEGQTVTDFNTLEFSEDQNLNHLQVNGEILYLIINKNNLYNFNEEMMDIEFIEKI